MTKFENQKFKYDRYDFKQIEINGVRTRVYRIISKINISTLQGMIVEGQKGGYCALGTLSEQGNCWVDNMSVVGPNCFVSAHAYVKRSLLAHDVSVNGRSYVFNSQINPNKNSSIVENSQILNSKIKGDLYMEGSAKLNSSTVDGDLKMQDEAFLHTCFIKADKRITVVGNTQYSCHEINGEGTIGISDQIELRHIGFSKSK